jgi:hypothetical protein
LQAFFSSVSSRTAQKVGTIISGDKIKIQAYCDIQKLAEQVAVANEKKNSEKVNQLVTLTHPRVLSLCVHRHGDDEQNSNNELSVH